MALPISGFDEIAQNQANKYLTHNETLRKLEAVLFRAASATTTAQPGSPSEGDVYIMPSTSTGTDWAGYSEHDIALYINTAWENITPWEGLRLYISNLKMHLLFDGTSWIPTAFLPIKIKDRNLSNLSVSPEPASGDAYILASGSPQQFPVNDIAVSDGANGWFSFTPTTGDLAYIEDEQVFSGFNTGSPLGWSAGTAI